MDAVEMHFRKRFHAKINPDLILRKFSVCGHIPALIVYMSGMADDDRINDFILRPLMNAEAFILMNGRVGKLDLSDLAGTICREALEVGEVKMESEISNAADAILDGMTALFVDGCAEFLILETHGYETRSVSAAENEKTVLGPKESFTENFKVNVSMIRRCIHRSDLVAETLPLGSNNRLRDALIYRKGFTDDALVNEVKRRLAGIEANLLLGSGMTEQLIEDRGVLPIPKVLSTERPDRAASHIMNGRACLIIEGSPLALVMPVTLFSLLNSPEDVYMRPPLGSLIRFIRYAGALISVLLPGYFLSLALYHQGGLTAEVLSTVIASRKMVFEPIAIEMILLLLVFLLIREAGLRVPGSIGQAIGIIGGLIMGQAAVAAHLASSVVLIIVAAAGLGNFCIPDYSLQITASYMRAAVVIAAWLGGLAAITAALLFTLCHMADIKSFGVPFLSPAAPKAFSKRPPVLRGALGGRYADDDLNTRDDTERTGRRA